MTVQKLIEELNAITDKSREVCIQDMNDFETWEFSLGGIHKDDEGVEIIMNVYINDYESGE